MSSVQQDAQHTPEAASSTRNTQTADALGSVRITKHVLATIIELTALAVPGVAKMAPVSSPWSRVLLRMQPKRGIAINVNGKTVSTDLFIILHPGAHMAQVGRAVQEAVAVALEDMLGMTPGEINVYIQDIQDVT